MNDETDYTSPRPQTAAQRRSDLYARFSGLTESMRGDGPDGRLLTFRDTLSAFSVHLLTASGAGFALLALISAAHGSWWGMFAWLAAALFVDGIDGPLARRLQIREMMPRWSGETLDLVVDFCTYVFVPAYAIAASTLMPYGLGIIASLAIVVTSALYFADTRMKMDDNHFRGFPAIWNTAAFYLFLNTPAPWLSFIFVLALVVMTFLPIPFIHPVRVIRHRTFHMALLVVWCVCASIAIVSHMAPGPMVTTVLNLVGLYIIGGGFISRGNK